MKISLSQEQLEAFHQQGFLVLREVASVKELSDINEAIKDNLFPPCEPIEYEAELNYPGAPESIDVEGGDTPRRLLRVYSRDSRFRHWATREDIVSIVGELLSEESISLTQSHHNCVMTKYPNFGSETGWHQDIRYWNFNDTNLVNVWLALGDEFSNNGGMRVIPESHQPTFDAACFDKASFFRTDVTDNQVWLEKAIEVNLYQGDVLLFHSRLLHAAGRNLSNNVKKSLVFTYHATENKPLSETRSDRFKSIKLS